MCTASGTRYLIGGEIREWKGDSKEVTSPVWLQGGSKPIVIGTSALLSKEEALAGIVCIRCVYVMML